jgi:solute carrier family 7 (cationic amino acid transporter), member 2
MDLLAIGIGGTVGSGVFVIAGDIANAEVDPTGPAVTVSFLAAVRASSHKVKQQLASHCPLALCG